MHPWTAQQAVKRPDNTLTLFCNLQVFYTRLNANEHSVPPPASSRYIVKDTGDCSPRFMRATLNNVPATADLCRMGAMPVAVTISPLALPDPQDNPIQVVLSLARPSCRMHCARATEVVERNGWTDDQMLPVAWCMLRHRLQI